MKRVLALVSITLISLASSLYGYNEANCETLRLQLQQQEYAVRAANSSQRKASAQAAVEKTKQQMQQQGCPERYYEN